MQEILKDIDIHESIKMDKHLLLKSPTTVTTTLTFQAFEQKNKTFVYTRKKISKNLLLFTHTWQKYSKMTK